MGTWQKLRQELRCAAHSPWHCTALRALTMPSAESAAAAAEHSQCVEQLLRTATAVHGIDGRVTLPLRLDLLPTVLQYLVSSRSGIEEHVAYLSLERLCLEALGLQQLMPRGRYDNLIEFETYQRAMLGESVWPASRMHTAIPQVYTSEASAATARRRMRSCTGKDLRAAVR